MTDQNTKTPWQDMVAPIVRKLTVGATFGETVQFNQTGAKALRDMITTMAETLDENNQTVLAAHRVIERQERDREFLIEVAKSLDLQEAAATHRHLARKFVHALFRARKKELRK